MTRTTRPGAAQGGRGGGGERVPTREDPAAPVHSWDVSTGTDGPGTRFVVFLTGCPLRCVYCHNPDTWKLAWGTPMRVSEVLDELASYERFLRVAGGGVTVSGGEPLLHPLFVERLFTACKERELHTALDTCGQPPAGATDDLLAVTDLVLLDIKSYDPATHKRVTGAEVHPTLELARRLDERGVPTIVRFVLVPGWTDDPDNVEGLAEFVAGLSVVEQVEVLGFHRLGQHKWERLGRDFPCADVTPPGREQLARAREPFARRGLSVR